MWNKLDPRTTGLASMFHNYEVNTEYPLICWGKAEYMKCSTDTCWMEEKANCWVFA